MGRHRSWKTFASENKTSHLLMTKLRAPLTVLRLAVSGVTLRGQLRVKLQSVFIRTKAKMRRKISGIKKPEIGKTLSQKIQKLELDRSKMILDQNLKILFQERSHQCMVDKNKEEKKIVMR